MMEVYKIYFKVITENRENKLLEWMLDYCPISSNPVAKSEILSKFLDALEKNFPNGNFAKIWIKTYYEEFLFLFTDVQELIHGFEKIYIFNHNHKRPEIVDLWIEHLHTLNDNYKIPLDKNPFNAATFYRFGPNSKTLFSNKKNWISTAYSYIL